MSTPSHKCEPMLYCLHTVADLNPRSRAVKTMEMAVRRALILIEAFNNAPEQDPTLITRTTWRELYGDRYYNSPEHRNMGELIRRYQDKSLHAQVVDMFNNLPPDLQEGLRDDVNRLAHGLA